VCKRRYNSKIWKIFTDCFNRLPIAAIVGEKIFAISSGLGPNLNSIEQIRRIMRPTDVSLRSSFLSLSTILFKKGIAGLTEH
jgi:hypothetical protein